MEIRNNQATKSFHLVTGASGTGKSTLWETLINSGGQDVTRLIFDPQLDYCAITGVQPCYSLEECNACIIGKYPAAYCPEKEFADYKEAFELWCNWAFKVSSIIPGVKKWGIDELWDLCDNTSDIPDGLLMAGNRGRKLQIEVYYATISVNEVHHDIRKSLSHLYSFWETDSLCLDWIEKGSNNMVTREQIMKLKTRGEYIIYDKLNRKIETRKTKPKGTRNNEPSDCRRETGDDSKQSENINPDCGKTFGACEGKDGEQNFDRGSNADIE